MASERGSGDDRLGFLRELLEGVYWMLKDEAVNRQLQCILRCEMESEHEAEIHRCNLSMSSPPPSTFLGSELEPDFPFAMYGHHTDGNACTIVLGAINDLAARHPLISPLDHPIVGPQHESLLPFWQRYVDAASNLRHWHLPRLKMLVSRAEKDLRMWGELSVVDVEDEDQLPHAEIGHVEHQLVLSEIEQLERDTPKLDPNNCLWVRNTKAAEIENLKVSTLGKYRRQGQSTTDKTFGQDADGRIWRRKGTPKSHPWYLRRTLVGEPAK